MPQPPQLIGVLAQLTLVVWAAAVKQAGGHGRQQDTNKVALLAVDELMLQEHMLHACMHDMQESTSCNVLDICHNWQWGAVSLTG